MPRFEMKKTVTFYAEIEAPNKAEAMRLADQECYGDWQLSATQFSATCITCGQPRCKGACKRG